MPHNDHDDYRQLDDAEMQRVFRLHPMNRIEILILSIIGCNPAVMSTPAAMFKTLHALSKAMSHRQRIAMVNLSRDFADEVEHEMMHDA